MIFIVGTAAPGGIDSVINDHLQSGIYKDHGVRRLITHKGAGKFIDICLFFRSVSILLLSLIQNKVTLVHAHMSYNASFWRKYLIFNICTFFKVPFVCHLHGSEFKDYVNNSSNFRRSRLTHLARGANAFLVLSKSWKEYVDQCFGIDSTILPNFIDIDKKYKEKSLVEQGDIIFIGAFIARKGVLELIEAFHRSRLGCKLRLCGSGPLLSAAQDLVEKYQLNSKVVFHGWVSGVEKYEIMSKCSVFVLPTYNEGLPLTILEAFATKTFVISTPVGAIPEVVVNQKSGLLVPVGDVNSLVESLTFYFSNIDKCSMMTNSAYSLYQERYTSDSVLPILADVYNSAHKGGL